MILKKEAEFFVSSNVNYGVAGVVVGHEIGHGFDDMGESILGILDRMEMHTRNNYRCKVISDMHSILQA